MGDAIAVKYTPEAGRLAGEDGNLKIDVIQPICAEEFFETFVNNALQRTQSSRKSFWKLLTHANCLTIIFVQETTSWDVPSLELPGYVCYGSKFGFAMVSEELETIEV